MTAPDTVVVWGNCQAPALADVLRGPLADHGLHVVDVPPVYQLGADQLAGVHAIVREAAVLVTQPVSDVYAVPGCGSRQLMALLPVRARTVTLPVVYHVGAFPFQTRGYGADGARIDAPLTDYHDLRVVRAAAQGRTGARRLTDLAHAGPQALRAVAAASRAELERRERDLDVRVTDLLDQPQALWTMTHPSNALLVALAQRVLGVLGIAADVVAPEREYLGQQRTPLDADVAAAHGWPAAAARPQWVIGGRPVLDDHLLDAQLRFYAARPDVVAATLARAAGRLTTLGL